MRGMLLFWLTMKLTMTSHKSCRRMRMPQPVSYTHLFAERMRGADKAPEQVAAEVDAVTADDVRRVLSRFRLAVCYTLTKEAGADA